MDLVELILKLFLISILNSLVILSVIRATKRFDYLDVFFPLQVLIYSLVAITSSNNLVSFSTLVLFLIITAWSIRLSYQMYLRLKLNDVDDFRYRLIIKKDKSSFINFMRVIYVQSWVSLMLAMAPIIVFFYSNLEFSVIKIIFIIFAIIGILIESIADSQLYKFRSDKINKKISKDSILNKGLFSLVRHPNYLGELIFWWSISIIAISQGYLLAIISPLCITIVLTQISGIPMLERKLLTNQEYREYSKNTPAIVPKIIKNLKQSKSKVK